MATRLHHGGTVPATPLGEALATLARVGSNSMVIGAARSASGAPLMANDPPPGPASSQLLAAGRRAVASYEMVGLMAPGLPFVGVGRGRHLAWGGTNMRASASDLVDVAGIDPKLVRTHNEKIRIRGLGSVTRRVRTTPYGPILNDAKLLRVQGGLVALRWMGQRPSDEIGAFLAASHAATPGAFRDALTDFGVCPQNILFATADGHIGHVHAAHLPRRPSLPEGVPVLSAQAADEAWRERWDAGSLPLTLDPPEGYVVSANDRPRHTNATLGFFYSEGARAKRLAQLADAHGLTLPDLQRFHRDTRTPDADRLAGALADLLEPVGGDPAVCALLRAWDGDYAADAAAPVVFETVLHRLATRLSRHPGIADHLELDGEWGRLTRLLLPDLATVDEATRATWLREAGAAARDTLRRHPTWGSLHRLRVSHVLGLIPVLGRRLRVADLPVGGSRETPMKTAHGLVSGRHGASYGAQARHVSDLSDPDQNHFVLLGGNDGWIGSAQFADQIPLWREGRYVHVPMRPAAVADAFATVIERQPGSSALRIANAEPFIDAPAR